MSKKIYDPYIKFGMNNNPDLKADLIDGKVPATQSQVRSVSGRTGAVTLSKTDVGLSNVDNTSDANKPISAATQTELNSKTNNTQVVPVERALAEIINQLNARILSLELFIQNPVFNNVQAESISTVKSLQLKGADLIRFGIGTPSFAPDFIGQIYVKTDTTTAVYVATGIATAADFKAV
jgi:hypothetical protein